MSVAAASAVWIGALVLWLVSSVWIRRAPEPRTGFRRTIMSFAIPIAGAALVSVALHREGSLPHLVMLSVSAVLAGLAWLSIGAPVPASVEQPPVADSPSREYKGVYYASSLRAESWKKWYPWDDGGPLRLEDGLLVFAGGKGTIELHDPVALGLRSQVWSPLPYAVALLVTLVSMFWVAFLAGAWFIAVPFLTLAPFAGYAYLLNRADKWLVVRGTRPGVGPETCYFHIGSLGQAIARSQREMQAFGKLLESAEPAHPGRLGAER